MTGTYINIIKSDEGDQLILIAVISNGKVKTKQMAVSRFLYNEPKAIDTIC